MKWAVLIALLFYYSLVSLVFVLGADHLSGYSTTSSLTNTTSFSESDINSTNPFTQIGRFASWVGFGVFPGVDFPVWFQVILSFWQVAINIITIVFIITMIPGFNNDS